MSNTITKNETVVQCSPITCEVASVTLGNESNQEALDAYTACGCEGASGASGLKNIIGGAAPFLIQFAAGFAVHGEDGAAWLQILSNRAMELEKKRDFQKATQTWLELAARYGEQHDLQGELTTLNRADESAKKIKDEGTRNNLRAEILEKMSNTHAELTEYAWAIDKMMESLRLSFSDVKYRRMLELIDMGVTVGHIIDTEGDTEGNNIRKELDEMRLATKRGKGAPKPAIDKSVEGQWALDPASAQMNAKELQRVVNMWTEAAEKMAKSGKVNALDAASRWHEKVAHIFEALHFDHEASKAYAAAAKAVLAKRDSMTAFDHERAAELFESATCEDGRDTATFYGAAGRNRWDAANILAKAGELGRALANVQMAIVDLSGGFETAAQLKTAEEFQTGLVKRLVQQAPRVQKYFQVSVTIPTVVEFLKRRDEGDWDKGSADQKLNWVETVRKAVAFALKNHPEELEPFIEEGGGQGRVLNADGCAKAMELWVKTTDRGPLRMGGADPVVDGVVSSLLGRYGDTSDLPRRPERPGRPERPAAIGKGHGGEGVDGEGRRVKDEGREGRGKGRKGRRGVL